ncbi:MAG: tRNA dihydrouridine synthase DusB [Bacteroides sp.]|nr:tRNA dihydrouridine synthase DusB [Bacteroides sp.]MCM1086118.1 tRNA dihydrouridine synthase DusB [Bacteroides sp.]MCM1168409.1 tRNA dihydrouridine synthase DusB [Bacteroides sp.]
MARIGKVELGDFPLWLAPMEAVTDAPFRSLCKRHGADVLVSEFISSDAVVRMAGKSLSKMAFQADERPTGIQIFGHDEQSMRQAAEIAAGYHPDFIDLNWGCPVRKIVSKGAGSGILQDIPKMVSITSAVVKAMDGLGLPVTVKTRLGWDASSKPIVEVAERLQDIGIAAISIHGRTRAQLYGGTADWSLIGAVKDNPRMKIPVFGNGDIDSAPKALQMKERYGVDGVLIGRAAIGNPWIFEQVRHFLETGQELPLPGVEERKRVCMQLFEKETECKGERVAAQEMKIHYSGFFKGLPNFKPVKMQLMLSSSMQEAHTLLDSYRGE